MKKLFVMLSMAAVAAAVACSDDDAADDAAGGSAGATSKGGTTGKGGTTSDGGTDSGGDTSTAAGSGGEAGSAPPAMCDPPSPPDLGAGGNSGGAGGAGTAGLDIVGSYTDDFDGTHEITNETWTSGASVYNISAFDNDEMYVIAQNDEGNAFDPCMWTRYDWVVDGGDLYFCTTAYNAESEAAALSTDRADDSDPANGGCGGPDFAWSLLTPE